MAEYINRKAVIRILEAMSNNTDCCGAEKKLKLAAKRIDGLYAPVKPEAHWTSVNEQLPPDGEDVLCWYEYFRYGEYNEMFQTHGVGYQYGGVWGGEAARGTKTKVLAWMPLPEPPKMDGGVNDGA